MVDLSQLEKIATPQDLEARDKSLKAIQYLRSTDWYVIRSVETGTPVPEDIKEQRAAARSVVI